MTTDFPPNLPKFPVVPIETYCSLRLRWIRFQRERRHHHNVVPRSAVSLPQLNHMDHILIDIASSLLRAAVATVLAKELYVVTVPSLIAFSVIAYEVLTRDPIRGSMPPYLGDKAAWEVIRGRRRPQGDTRDIVRLSIFGKDV